MAAVRSLVLGFTNYWAASTIMRRQPRRMTNQRHPTAIIGMASGMTSMTAPFAISWPCRRAPLIMRHTTALWRAYFKAWSSQAAQL